MARSDCTASDRERLRPCMPHARTPHALGRDVFGCARQASGIRTGAGAIHVRRPRIPYLDKRL